MLCNALVLKEQTRQTFIDLGYEGKACERLKNDDRDDEFLCSRLLFLTTYGTSVDLTALIEKHGLAESVTKNLERHAAFRSSGTVPSDPMIDMAMTETLKLLFNITHFATAHTAAFTPIIPHVVQLLCQTETTTSKPLDPPVNFLVNALLNLDLGAADIQDALYPADDPEGVARHVIDLLAKSSTAYREMEYDVAVTPLLGVVRGLHEYAPAAVKASMRTQLLPAEGDRAEVLGRGTSLSGWLLRNTTNPLAPKTREVISDLLYDMSDRDATAFVENVGYGFASGYLFNKNIPIPASLTPGYTGEGEGAQEIEEGGKSSGTTGAPSGAVANASVIANSSSGRPVNPITGQFLDKERQPEGPEMTEEEKEREAERLFVLFERYVWKQQSLTFQLYHAQNSSHLLPLQAQGLVNSGRCIAALRKKTISDQQLEKHQDIPFSYSHEMCFPVPPNEIKVLTQFIKSQHIDSEQTASSLPRTRSARLSSRVVSRSWATMKRRRVPNPMTKTKRTLPRGRNRTYPVSWGERPRATFVHMAPCSAVGKAGPDV